LTDYEPLAQLFKMLTHPARLAILNELRQAEACVCHLENKLGYRQAYLSQQLAALREAGLVQDRREGWNIYYRVSQPQVFDLIDQAAQLSGPAAEKATRRKRKLTACPCPKCNPSNN
jgi:DNA-binding transcriptional ArsR family regulator